MRISRTGEEEGHCGWTTESGKSNKNEKIIVRAGKKGGYKERENLLDRSWTAGGF